MAYKPPRRVIRREITDNEAQNLELQMILAHIKASQRLTDQSHLNFIPLVKGNKATRVVEILQGKEPVEESLLLEDLDMVLCHYYPLGYELRRGKDGEDSPILALAKTIQAAFPHYRLNENIETKHIGNDHSINNTIIDILRTRDMDKNEAVLALEEGRMVLYYTQECWDAIKERRATPATGSGSITRLHYGLIVVLPLYAERAIRAAVERKIDSFYLPKEQIQLLWDAARVGNKKYEPLQHYGLFLCDRYKNLPLYQERMMKLLIELNLTKAKDFAGYKKMLEAEYEEKYGKEFVLQERSFEQVFLSRKDVEKNRNDKRHDSKIIRARCKLRLHRETLHGRDKGCWIDYCPVCNEFKIFDEQGNRIYPQDLQSNVDLITTDIKNISKKDYVDAASIIASVPVPA